jgi:hypothetical protein
MGKLSGLLATNRDILQKQRPDTELETRSELVPTEDRLSFLKTCMQTQAVFPYAFRAAAQYIHGVSEMTNRYCIVNVVNSLNNDFSGVSSILMKS